MGGVSLCEYPLERLGGDGRVFMASVYRGRVFIPSDAKATQQMEAGGRGNLRFLLLLAPHPYVCLE